MSLKSSLLALANNIGMCQENARSIKQALSVGLAGVATNASGIDGAISSKKLWVNATPTASFPATDVTVDNSDDYDAFIVAYEHFTWSGIQLWMIDKSAINDNTDHTIVQSYVDNPIGTVMKDRRSLRLTQAEDSSSLKFAFAGGYRDTIATYGSEGSSSAKNNAMLPIYIIGIKF